MNDLSGDEVKGRWKSFLGKWNRGELDAKWYAAASRANEAPSSADVATFKGRALPGPKLLDPEAKVEDNDDDEDDGYGPAPPEATQSGVGPAMPSFQDLQHRQELTAEDCEARIADLRHERKLDRLTQKERLEDLAPRAEPGTRERQLEKKREINASNRAFAQAKEGGDMQEVAEGDLMGDGEDEYKRRKLAQQRQKNEREVRKEEMLRARAAEREERLQGARRKEEKTIEMLREIARQRFGGE